MYCISARAQYVRCFVKCVCVMFYDMFFILYFPRLCLFLSHTSEDLNSMDVSIVSFFLQMWESVYLCHQSTGFNFILFGKLATRFLCFISRKQQDKNRNKIIKEGIYTQWSALKWSSPLSNVYVFYNSHIYSVFSLNF